MNPAPDELETEEANAKMIEDISHGLAARPDYVPLVHRIVCEEGMGWQPIATAPKDGSKLDDRMILVSYPIAHHPFHKCACVQWSHDKDCWYIVGSAMVIGKLIPTHWMPIPDAPKA